MDAKPESWSTTIVKALALTLSLAILAVPLALMLKGIVPSGWEFAAIEGARDLLGPQTSSSRPFLRRAARQPPPLPSPVAPPAPPNCSLDIRQTPFAGSCTLLSDVCLDQGRIILYDPKYRPKGHNAPPIDLPDLKPSSRQKAFYLQYWQQRNSDLDYGLPPVPIRTASSTEPRQYLLNPSFSSCTVPVLYYQHNAFNFAHTFRDNAALFFSALQATPWADHVKVLLQTGGGLAITGMNQALWQPISQLSVESLADFSVRLPDGQVGQLPSSQGGRPPTYEGTNQRCFRHMFVCLRALAVPRWEIHAYGQLLVQHYGGKQLVRSVAEARAPGEADVPPPLPPPVSILAQLSRVPGSDAGKAAAKERVLRVVFQKRGSDDRRNPDRQLVNAAELVQACNGWRFTAPSGARVRAVCWEVELTSLEAGIAVAQRADIFVGAHGANIANAWLMRPGSAVVELTMFEFEQAQAHINLARRNFHDPGTQVQFFKLLLCDPEGSWTPGRREKLDRRQGKMGDKAWPKYRNLVVRWEALRTALEAAVETGGDMAAYRQRYNEGRWWWLSTATRTVYAGPNQDMTCRIARQQGLIS